MKAAELLLLAASFAQTRWGLRFRDRAAFERWQGARLDRFLRSTLHEAPFYRGLPYDGLASLPVVDKHTTLQRFEAFNTRGISLHTATGLALAAEQSRPLDRNAHADLAAGLSSGTQGPRGIFLVSARERAQWAGIMLARTLSAELFEDVLKRPAPLRVAFFLRANSSLYTTLSNRRIDFRFFDLQAGPEAHLKPLGSFEPEVLVAPASVLAWLAQASSAGDLPIRPRRVISVAEVLEPDDVQHIVSAYGLPVRQLYQCTEGFLAFTCEHGTLHLNEEFVHVEPEWTDESRTRFVPVITDFTRRTQLIVRYRMTDVLSAGPTACACGRVTRTLAAINGRIDDVLWLPAKDGSRLMPLFPDALRHVLARQVTAIADYRIAQHGDTLHLAIDGGDRGAFVSMSKAIDMLIAAQGMRVPEWRQIGMPVEAPAAKRRRIVCVRKPAPRTEATSHR